MNQVGIIGWRGMVGSVLLDRMREERDFDHVEPVFFSTSQAGAAAPPSGGSTTGRAAGRVLDANDIDALKSLPILISTQGGDYTNAIHPKLRASGWQGYWIDAASALRMDESTVIALDPVNLAVMKRAKRAGVKDFIGGNCTVSLMLMGLGGLATEGHIEWVTAMTYQSASGAGAQHMRELIEQMGVVHAAAGPLLSDPGASILDIDRTVGAAIASPQFPTEQFGAPLAGSLIPWIDKDLGNGQSREEWKAAAEANKILGLAPNTLAVEGVCVRVSAMRCHSQALTIKLKRDIPLDAIERIILSGNDWVRIVKNTREDSIRELSPAAVSGKMTVPIGRLRKLSIGPQYLSAFTVGDQLLWGAAEPLRRTLRLLVDPAF